MVYPPGASLCPGPLGTHEPPLLPCCETLGDSIWPPLGQLLDIGHEASSFFTLSAFLGFMFLNELTYRLYKGLDELLSTKGFAYRKKKT